MQGLPSACGRLRLLLFFLVTIVATVTAPIRGQDAPPAPAAAARPTPPRFPFDAEAAKRHQSAWAECLGVEAEEENTVGMRMRLIPPGSFLMGSPADEAERNDNEDQVSVTLTEPFWLGAYEVTRGEFGAFVEATGYKTDAERDGGGEGWDEATGELKLDAKYSWRDPGFSLTESHPVVNVSWHDAQAYCKWLSGRERRSYRLPTEAEWEWACRAGSGSAYFFGDDPEGLARVDNVPDGTFKAKHPDWETITALDGYVFTSPAGRYGPNAFGLYDVHGNVCEWCEDAYGDDLPGGPNPLRTRSPDARLRLRVVRGGAWDILAWYCRSARREAYGTTPSCDQGFRVACAAGE